ncbi:MAG: aquaporin [Acidimicrobiia bacterium]
MQTWQKYAAEAYGTFVLVGIGTGAILGAIATGGGVLTVALAFGLALIAGLYTVGRLSGGHFNPAVSLAMFLDKRLSATDMLFYWASQVVGALLASLTLAWVIGKDAVALTITRLDTQLVDTTGGIVGEALFTMVLVMAILVISKSPSYSKYLGIGLTFTAVILMGAAFTGGSVNPARSLAPAIVGGDMTDIWVYMIGPAIGAVVAWVLYKVIVTGDTDLRDDVATLM